MEVDLERELADRTYPILASLVTPRKLFLIGRMASPHWYCRTRDRFEMIRPE